MSVFDDLSAILGCDAVKVNEPMSAHTTFRVGGPADYFVQPKTTGQLQELLSYIRRTKLPYTVLGNGSNLLVSDEGYRGIVLHLCESFHSVSTEGTVVTAQSGALLSKIAAAACQSGLTGMEFAAGIPGTLGGACIMNAGAYGGEMKQVLTSVTVLSPAGEIRRLSVDELALGYRTSILAHSHDIVLEASMQLTNGDPLAIRQTMAELAARRREKQPLEYGSAGSTFKRPEGHFAGKLIQDAGLRGFQIGDAAVSEKHCGFIINKGAATASDIWNVILSVQEQVQQKFGITLEPEVKFLGNFS